MANPSGADRHAHKRPVGAPIKRPHWIAIPFMAAFTILVPPEWLR